MSPTFLLPMPMPPSMQYDSDKGSIGGTQASATREVLNAKETNAAFCNGSKVGDLNLL